MKVYLCDIIDINKEIVIDTNKYRVLIPKEFKNIQGNYTLFELVALWNKDYLTADDLGIKPHINHYRGFDEFLIEEYKKQGKTDEEISKLEYDYKYEFYVKDLNEYNTNLDKIEDFKVLSDLEMQQKYGVDYLHEIGVAIYQSNNLKYPIKVTYSKDISYEDYQVRSV